MLVFRLITVYTEHKSVKLSNRCVLAGPKVRKFSKEWKVDVEFIIFDVLSVTEYFLNIELKIDKCEHFNLLKDKKISFYQEPREPIPKRANLYEYVFIL